MNDDWVSDYWKVVAEIQAEEDRRILEILNACAIVGTPYKRDWVEVEIPEAPDEDG